MKEEFKNIKPILKKKDPKIVDPVRYPKVILGFENMSKKDYLESLKIQGDHLLTEMNKYIK